MSDIVERWPNYTEQSWSERFAELDKAFKHQQSIIDGLVRHIVAKSAELAEARADMVDKATAWDACIEAGKKARDKALDEAAETMENLSFMTDISDLIGMTKQEMSVRTCHEGAQAIRALKSPKPPIL